MTFSDIPYANSEYYSSLLLPERPILVFVFVVVVLFVCRFLFVFSYYFYLFRLFCSCQLHTLCTGMIPILRSINQFVQITAPSSNVAASNCTLN